MGSSVWPIFRPFFFLIFIYLFFFVSSFNCPEFTVFLIWSVFEVRLHLQVHCYILFYSLLFFSFYVLPKLKKA
jgi:hypothetical protein